MEFKLLTSLSLRAEKLEVVDKWGIKAQRVIHLAEKGQARIGGKV